MSHWVDFLVLDYIVGSEAWGSVANSVAANFVVANSVVAVDDAVDAVVEVDDAVDAVEDGNSVGLLLILGAS